ncbi:hypothetical protein SBOR_4715 [Sclerotinia borealis F-4128]|uniref:Uncharacterized protein n=1 Tax=Sclerotinia borealis (strain F-4128) TaxID=1432307 RepID=W9CG71_SCLBF|nr:hypothetical protein SBOR_4715 [Sclerotinia borealis F-4128]
MNQRNGILLLYRRAVKSSNFPAISAFPRRSKWSYKSSEPLNLSETVIDLDAPNSPAVRDYDESKDNVPTRTKLQIIRSTDRAMARRARLVRKQLEEGVEGFPRKRNQKSQRIRDDMLEHELAHYPNVSSPPVTPLDLMTYALLGNPFTTRKPNDIVKKSNSHMEKLFIAHGINFLDTANITIRALTEDFDIETDGKGGEIPVEYQEEEYKKKRARRGRTDDEIQSKEEKKERKKASAEIWRIYHETQSEKQLEEQDKERNGEQNEKQEGSSLDKRSDIPLDL